MSATALSGWKWMSTIITTIMGMMITLTRSMMITDMLMKVKTREFSATPTCGCDLRF